MDMDSKKKLEHLHNLVSFVSRKRVFIEANLHNLDAFFMFRGAKELCAKVWLDEDFFENAVEDNYEFPEEEINNLLRVFFDHAHMLNSFIQAIKTGNVDEHWSILDGYDDGIDDELLGDLSDFELEE